MRAAITLALVATFFISSGVGAQSLQPLTSAELATLPVAGGRIGVEIRPGRLFEKPEAFSAEVVEVKEQSAFSGRLESGEHILAVQSYSFGNMADMMRYINSLPPKSLVHLLVAGAQDGKLRIVKGQLIGANQLLAAQKPEAGRPSAKPNGAVRIGAVSPPQAAAPVTGPNKEEPSCLKEAGKGVAVAVIGTAILVGLDCLFTACAFTVTALSTSAGVVTTAAVAAKGTAIVAAGAAGGCAKALVN